MRKKSYTGRRGGPTLDVVVFRLGPQHFGIPVAQVGQVFPVTEISPLSGASVPVRGTVDVHGDLTPVVDLGRRSANAWTELYTDQQFILVEGPTRRLILLADEVEGVRSVPDGSLASDGLIYVDDALATEPQGPQSDGG
jgi:purine-binding chemotaxis protein CheW